MLEIDGYRHGHWSVVSVVGDLDLAGLPQFRSATGPLVNESKPRIVVDLTALDLLDSSGLGALLGLRRRVLRNGGEVRLVAPDDNVTALLHTVGFDRIFAISPTLGDAIGEDPNPASGVDGDPADA
ncbi:MAG: STAS domain-containing protein [Acidimicrobiales bacterium]